MKLFSIFAAALILVLTPLVPASAESIGIRQIAEILTERGYNVRDEGPQTVAVTHEKYLIFIYIDRQDSDISYIVEFPEIRGEHLSYSLLNAFNHGVKFGRAYVDQNGYLTLQMDRNASGGVSSENVESDFDVFLLLISAFLSHLESQRIA